MLAKKTKHLKPLKNTKIRATKRLPRPNQKKLKTRSSPKTKKLAKNPKVARVRKKQNLRRKENSIKGSI